MKKSGFIPPHGNYQALLCHQKAEAIYDLTYVFCQRFLQRGDRTVDQMVQAARSGKQNISEGNQAGGLSKETELKLTSVARASLEELLEDYGDFLRTRKLRRWEKDSREALFVRRLGHGTHVSHETYRTYVETRSAEVVANLAICVIHQANFLLDQLIRHLEQEFLEQGGLRERMGKARREVRDRR
jgi:four helix bundle suffix protein